MYNRRMAERKPRDRDPRKQAIATTVYEAEEDLRATCARLGKDPAAAGRMVRRITDGFMTVPEAVAIVLALLEPAPAATTRQRTREYHEPVSEGTKVCTKCGEQKPMTEFYAHRTSKDGRASRCKPCWREAYDPSYKPTTDQEESAA